MARNMAKLGAVMLLVTLLLPAGCRKRIVLTGSDKIYTMEVIGRRLILKRKNETYEFKIDRELGFEWGEKRWVLTDARFWKLLKQARLNAPED